MRACVIGLIGLLTAGCGECTANDEPESSAREGEHRGPNNEEPSEEESSEDRERPEKLAVQENEAPSDPPATGPDGPIPEEEMEEVFNELGEAIENAVNASETATGDHCDRALAGYIALITEMRGVFPAGSDRAPPDPETLDRAGFLQTCRTLPEAVQQCLVVSYANEHRAECQAAQSQVTPEQMENLRSILLGESNTTRAGPSPGVAPAPE